MSVEILFDSDEDKAALFCNTTDWVFGPIISSFNGPDEHDGDHKSWTEKLLADPEHHYHSADEMAELFLTYMLNVREVVDPRGMNKGDMWNIYADFLTAHKQHCPPK